MKILRPLPIDYVVVEFDGTEKDSRTKSGFADAACKVVHIDEVPQVVIQEYLNNHN